MTLNNLLLISQLSAYVIAFILSLCITVPMSFHQQEFRGHCLLFSNGTWTDEGQLAVNWASQAYCNYTIFVGFLLAVVSLVQIYRMSMFVYKETDSSFLSAFVDVMASLLLCAMTVAAALMITLGFMVWCHDMTERFPSCEIAAGNAFDKQDGIDTANFYIELGTAQFGVWASMACWVGLTVFATLKLCRYHQLENMRVSMFRRMMYGFGAWASMACWVGLTVFATLKLCRYHQLENMRVSMFRERQRLVNEGSGNINDISATTVPVPAQI